MLFNTDDILETTRMITQNKLDVRTITMGISLRDCGHPDIKVTAQKIYDKICHKAEHLVKTGENIEVELGVPIINKRISVTPISMVGESCDSNDYVPLAQALDNAGKQVGVNFIGGFSALVDKGYTKGDRNLIASIPEALAVTDIVCSSVSVGSTKCGINMDAVKQMGEVVKAAAERTADRDAIGCAKLVVFCNAVPDNPFMAGAFHGVTEPESPRRPAGSTGGCTPPEYPVRHYRPVLGSDSGNRRQCCAYSGGNRSGKLRRPRHYRYPGYAERRS